MQKIAIIDDEPDARAVLKALLAAYRPEFTLVGEADSVASGAAMLRQTQPDSLLLDVQLLDGSGFDLLERFPAAPWRVLFVTAYDRYALKAFRFNALDYLLKPVDPEEFVRATAKLLAGVPATLPQQLAGAAEAVRRHALEKIAVHTADGITLLRLDEIICLEADTNYTRIHLREGKPVVAARTLGEFEALLQGESFCRVHHSHLVNLRHVRKFLKEDGGMALMDTGLKVAIARRRKEAFLELLLK